MGLNSSKSKCFEILPATKNWLISDKDLLVKLATLSDTCLTEQKSPKILKEIEQIKTEIFISGIVPKIFQQQNPAGYWGNPPDFYLRSKYKGTIWSFLLLAELGVPGFEPRIKNTIEFLFRWSQDRKSGGFTYRGIENIGGIHENIIPCLTGNLTWAMLRFGYGNDVRLQKAVDWITQYLRFDDGDTSAPLEWPYRFPQCWGKHTCMMGIVKCLKALAEIPPPQRSLPVQNIITQSVDFILKHHLFQMSHQKGQIGNQQWIQLGFPRFWKTDILEMLDILTQLGVHDSRMQDAINIIEEKMTIEQKWMLEDTWNGRMLVKIEKKNELSKWITFQALCVLCKWYK